MSKNLAEKPLPISPQLERAISHVNDNWFPINPDLYEKIRNKIYKGQDTDDGSWFLEEAKQDCSLFLYSLRRLSSIIKEKDTEQKTKDPLEVLKNADIKLLKEIMSDQPSTISTHKFKTSSKSQAARLSNMIISSTTASVLSEPLKLDSDVGFSAGVLRQLGIVLIAYNYPHLYEKSMAQLLEGQSLDRVLSRLLGFTPTLLGLHLARSWGISAETRKAMGDTYATSSNLDPKKLDETAGLLSKICEIGETLAKINDPEHYPPSRTDTELVHREVVSILGPSGMASVSQAIFEVSGAYRASQPELFDSIIPSASKRESLAKVRAAELAGKNLYLKRCSEDVVRAVKEGYQKVDPIKGVSREAIEILIAKAVPICGFGVGCIYIVDPESELLIPRLAIGMVSLNRFYSVSYKDYSPSTDRIATAFRCSSILREDSPSFLDGAFVTSFAGVLGRFQKAGVLYLETPEQSNQLDDETLTNSFKALRHAITDAFSLS